MVAKIGIGYNDDPIFQNLAMEVRTAATPEKSLHALAGGVGVFRTSVRGKNDELYHAALNRILNTPYDVWHQPNSETEIVDLLASVYPERVAYAGGQAVMELTALARAEAEKRGLPLRPGVNILAGLMFFLGADCANTPYIRG